MSSRVVRLVSLERQGQCCDYRGSNPRLLVSKARAFISTEDLVVIPTYPPTIFMLLNSSQDINFVDKSCWFSDLEALNLEKGRSGSVTCILTVDFAIWECMEEFFEVQKLGSTYFKVTKLQNVSSDIVNCQVPFFRVSNLFVFTHVRLVNLQT